MEKSSQNHRTASEQSAPGKGPVSPVGLCVQGGLRSGRADAISMADAATQSSKWEGLPTRHIVAPAGLTDNKIEQPQLQSTNCWTQLVSPRRSDGTRATAVLAAGQDQKALRWSKDRTSLEHHHTLPESKRVREILRTRGEWEEPRISRTSKP